MKNVRQQRVTELLYQELSIMISNELEDPRLSLLTVTGVQVTKDLRNAKVFISHQQEDVSRAEMLKCLRRATPFLRSQLAVRCSLRLVPELFFYYDDTPEKVGRVQEILQQIAQERTQPTSVNQNVDQNSV